MIGRVKVTTSIERNVSLYTTPDKNTSNGKHAAFPKFTKEEIGAKHCIGSDSLCIAMIADS